MPWYSAIYPYSSSLQNLKQNKVDTLLWGWLSSKQVKLLDCALLWVKPYTLNNNKSKWHTRAPTYMLSVPELIPYGAYPKHRSLSRTGFIPSTGAYSAERNLFQAPVLIPDGASPKHRSFSRTELIPCTGTYIGRSLSQAPKLIPNGVYSKHWSLSHNVF